MNRQEILLKAFNNLVDEVEKKLKEKKINLENFGEYTNLKLHDTSFLIGKLLEEEKYNEETLNMAWEDMINFEWDYFRDELEIKQLELIHLGRTSSFQIWENSTYSTINPSYVYGSDFSNKTIREKIIMLIIEHIWSEYGGCCEFIDTFNKEKITSISEGDIAFFVSTYNNYSLNRLLNEVYDNFDYEGIENICESYEYIEKFKANQEDIYRDYLRSVIENLEAMEEE